MTEMIGTAIVGNSKRPAAGAAIPTPAAPLPITEKQFQATVLQLARRHGWLAYHTHDSRKSAAGFWDCTLIRGRVLIGAELKVGSNRVSAAQATWLEALGGVEVVQSSVWRPEMWEAIEGVLTV